MVEITLLGEKNFVKIYLYECLSRILIIVSAALRVEILTISFYPSAYMRKDSLCNSGYLRL